MSNGGGGDENPEMVMWIYTKRQNQKHSDTRAIESCAHRGKIGIPKIEVVWTHTATRRHTYLQKSTNVGNDRKSKTRKTTENFDELSDRRYKKPWSKNRKMPCREMFGKNQLILLTPNNWDKSNIMEKKKKTGGDRPD